VNIPGQRQEDTQAWRSGSSPKGSFILDIGDDIVDGGLSSIEHTVIALLPNQPRGQKRDGGETFAKSFGRRLLGLAPPSLERVVMLWRPICNYLYH
jgi:hypothetical protein